MIPLSAPIEIHISGSQSLILRLDTNPLPLVTALEPHVHVHCTSDKLVSDAQKHAGVLCPLYAHLPYALRAGVAGSQG
jgi:hypothetical protein